MTDGTENTTAQFDRVIEHLLPQARYPDHNAKRLSVLLSAMTTVGGQLSLDTVLTTIVATARELAGAKYGALGVIGAEREGLERFVHSGMDPETSHAIGALPKGLGLLGALISDPRPLRLDHISDDPRSSGFPAQHPKMDAFLGVPILVRGEVFGNLYLAESEHGRFSAEDEELVSALAVAAGTAIGNARLYDEATLQQRWLTASAGIGEQLLSGSGDDPLKTIARSALEIADADTVTLGVLADAGSSLLVEVALGRGTESLVGNRFPLSDIVGGLAVEGRRPLRFHVAHLPEERTSTLAQIVDAGPMMVLPLHGDAEVRGVLTLVRLRGRRGFTDSDLRMAASFASHASIALELADAAAAEQRLVLLEDRDWIARDLHDHVIQELFSIGLSLQGVAMTLGLDQPLGERVQQRVDDIDRTIRRIRTSIFALRGPLDATTGGLRDALLAVINDLTPLLGFAPHASFTGLVDIAIDAQLAADLEAVVREALTNVVRHAQARSVDIDLSATTDDVVLSVSDDGVGLGDEQRRSGLDNLRRRAEWHGGSISVTSNGSGGTTLSWKAPL